MTSKEIFDAGYAIPAYSVDKELWRYREEVIEAHAPKIDIGLPFKVARIEDVRERN